VADATLTGTWRSWTAASIAEAVRGGGLSPRDAVAESLRRIAEQDAAIQAFQVVRQERALAEAEELERRSAGLHELALAGVPVAVKDNIDVAGEPTRDGSLATSASPRATDHILVRRLRAAGAVIVGKTRVPELCVFGATDSHFGITRNPCDLQRTPGGSSGGSAAAVSAAMVPVAHGNDGMGSIRLPAACCGVIGIKPGASLVPVDLGATGWYGLAENGVLAMNVSDAALMLAVMSGRTELQQVDPEPKPLRIAVAIDPPVIGLPLDREYVAAARRAGDTLAAAGHQVRAAPLPYSIRSNLAAVALWTAGTHDDAELLDASRLQPSIRRHAAIGGFLKRRGWITQAARLRWRERLARFFEHYDVALTPALAQLPLTAVRWGERSWLRNMVANARFAPYQQPWNLAGYPAITVPFGRHSFGLPLAVQLASRSGGEGTLLALAAQLEGPR
jgi:amidase